jgi:hypothetical protein
MKKVSIKPTSKKVTSQTHAAREAQQVKQGQKKPKNPQSAV